MVTLAIDTAASSLSIRTRAKGLLARLAHDLELKAEKFSGNVELDGESWKAQLRFPVRGLKVVGVMRGGQVRRDVLSVSDRESIDDKLGREVLTGSELNVEASGIKHSQAELTVKAPRGSQQVRAALTTAGAQETGLRVSGELELSLKALGVKEVKGPLGAFRVDDKVQIRFVIVLTAASSEN